MKIDLSQFRQTYLQESAEHVASMEADLLALRSSPQDVERLNAIFRSAHSIKGGAGTFGFTQLTQFTHALESLLEGLRSLETPATAGVIGLLLQSVDVLRAMLDVDRKEAGAENAMPEEAQELIERFDSLRGAAGNVTLTGAGAEASAGQAAAGNLTLYRVDFRPHRAMLSSGANPILLLRNLAALGTVSVCQLHTDDLPPLQELDPLQCYLRWTIELASVHPEEALREVFEFVEHLADIDVHQAPQAIEPLGPQSPLHSKTSVKTLPAVAADPQDLEERRNAKQRRTIAARRSADARKEMKSAAALAEMSSIRVATSKVDRLIDMVGELVIAQVMTAQMITDFEPGQLPKLRDAVSAMERSTRELHERVMAVRMMPVGLLFQRYVRVLYDIAQSSGKQIRLETSGEETEIDKSMLELLGDPLTHLVRNAADHAIESCAARLAAGKAAEGLIRMQAFHRAGRVVLEISDDGAGIDTARVRAKAVERGLIDAAAELTEDEILMLIFEPGFSTREAVSDLSGRGVGMDVVKRNVQQLSGTVGVASVLGKGSVMSIELPLTLAILEGLLVRVADRTLVIPLAAVVEAVSLRTNQIRRVAEQAEVIVIREESIPILRLRRFLGIEPPAFTDPEVRDCCGNRLVVVVEASRKKIGLVIDELLGQQQVVVKSLEKHLHRVEGLMGATILGDGRVAPIIDVTALAGLDLFSIASPSKKLRLRASSALPPQAAGSPAERGVSRHELV